MVTAWQDYDAHNMTQVKAAFTLTGRLSSDRAKRAAYAAGQSLGIPVERVRAAVADGWCVLSARLGDVTGDQAHGWLLLTVTMIEQDDYAEVFRIEINGEIRPLQA